MSVPAHSPAVSYAHRLLRDSAVLSRAQLSAVQSVLPEMASPDLAELGLATASANLEAFAAAVEHGLDPHASPPAVALAFARQLVWTDITIDALVRAYRLGHEWLHEDLRAFCRAECADDHDAVVLLGELGHLAFRFTDLSTAAVIHEYQRERDALLRNDLAQRNSLIRAILDERPVDITRAERTLGYRFDARHTAVRVWITDAEDQSNSRLLADALAAITRATVDRAPLVVQDGPAVLTAWLHGELRAPAFSRVGEVLQQYPSVRAAVGTTRSGLNGFRRTYEQAERARIVGPAPRSQLVAYHDVCLVALLLENPDAARAYADEELGTLAAPDPNSAVLRATLLMFLEHQCRHLPTAEAMYVHRNTVAQRVRRAEDILRRPVTDRPTELEAALRIQKHFDEIAAGTADVDTR